jgi:hypothetical protein
LLKNKNQGYLSGWVKNHKKGNGDYGILNSSDVAVTGLSVIFDQPLTVALYSPSSGFFILAVISFDSLGSNVTRTCAEAGR